MHIHRNFNNSKPISLPLAGNYFQLYTQKLQQIMRKEMFL